jgi:hypothetical protein
LTAFQLPTPSRWFRLRSCSRYIERQNSSKSHLGLAPAMLDRVLNAVPRQT